VAPATRSGGIVGEVYAAPRLLTRGSIQRETHAQAAHWLLFQRSVRSAATLVVPPAARASRKTRDIIARMFNIMSQTKSAGREAWRMVARPQQKMPAVDR